VNYVPGSCKAQLVRNLAPDRYLAKQGNLGFYLCSFFNKVSILLPHNKIAHLGKDLRVKYNIFTPIIIPKAHFPVIVEKRICLENGGANIHTPKCKGELEKGYSNATTETKISFVTMRRLVQSVM
jgi:hypothetical protein